jgi:MFS transporter, DHA2 family, methylenomycin A resistance protein
VVVESVPGRRTGVASGVFNTSRQVRGALAVAVFGALISAFGGFLHGARISLLVTAVLGLAAAAAGFTLKPRPTVHEEMA